ncbi:MAG TPA: hypothetical protein VIV11_37060 [Kofleriaceae bacterium]
MLRSVLLCLVLATTSAHARSEKTLAYPREPAWAAAVRFIRINAGLKVIEKDAEAGYVIFEFKEEKKTFRGSLELIEVVKDGRKLLRFVMTIEDRPQWVEIELLTKLERKLRAELGTPAPTPSPKPKDKEAPPPKPDDKPAPPKDEGPPVSDTP